MQICWGSCLLSRPSGVIHLLCRVTIIRLDVVGKQLFYLSERFEFWVVIDSYTFLVILVVSEVLNLKLNSFQIRILSSHYSSDDMSSY